MATLINGNGNLAIYAQQDADWYAALMGGQTVITAVGNQFAYELLAANTIGVKDGVIITTEGRRIQLDANAIDSFDIPTGAQGTTNYYIIGYHLVTGNQSEQTCETFVQLMENGTDTIPEGSFRDGDDEVFVSLYRVEQDDLTIGTITLLLPQLSGSFQSQITELNNDLTASDNLKFRFAKSGTSYGYEDSNGNFVPFKNPTGTKSITANGTYDVTDYASASVNVATDAVYEIYSKTSGANTMSIWGNPNSSYAYIKDMTWTYNNIPFASNDLFTLSYSNYNFVLTAKTTIKRSSYKSMTSSTTMTSGTTYTFPYATAATHFYVQKA